MVGKVKFIPSKLLLVQESWPILVLSHLASQPSVRLPPFTPRGQCRILAQRSPARLLIVPLDALSCVKSLPFNDNLRQNDLHNVARFFDFHTFEDSTWILQPHSKSRQPTSVPILPGSMLPHMKSVFITLLLISITWTILWTDYDFNEDLYDFISQLDGHTLWLPSCYTVCLFRALERLT